MGWVKVTSYSASAKAHAVTNLEKWNQALERVALLSYFQVSCQADNEQLFLIHGTTRDPNNRFTWVGARFSEGQLVEILGPK